MRAQGVRTARKTARARSRAVGAGRVSATVRRTLEAIARTPEGVCAVDETQRIVLWNEGASRITGYSARETVGKPCYQVIAGCDPEGNPTCAKRCPDLVLAKARLPLPSRDLVTHAKDGEEVGLNITNIWFPTDQGRHPIVVHIFRKVSTQQRLEQFVKKLSRHVEQCPAFQVWPPSNSHSAVPAYDQLTSREREVLKLLAEGNNATSIARALVISPATVRKHIQNMLRKLGMHSCLEAVAYISRADVAQETAEATHPFPTSGLEAEGW